MTFDMSAANDNATKILTSLQASRTPASWFSTGAFATKNKDFVASVAAAGFSVYNHGQESKDYTTLTADQISGQITDADAVIRTATHTSTQPFFRPPFGPGHSRRQERRVLRCPLDRGCV
ncbi:MAG: polysaccharide deacetylase family protein [Candidatus Kerfeldbacteria bacterium]|nr:polysaccharide deacetylase family protein [Candidatus Kerfeldbacteria bacterium]